MAEARHSNPGAHTPTHPTLPPTQTLLWLNYCQAQYNPRWPHWCRNVTATSLSGARHHHNDGTVFTSLRWEMTPARELWQHHVVTNQRVVSYVEELYETRQHFVTLQNWTLHSKVTLFTSLRWEMSPGRELWQHHVVTKREIVSVSSFLHSFISEPLPLLWKCWQGLSWAQIMWARLYKQGSLKQSSIRGDYSIFCQKQLLWNPHLLLISRVHW